MDSKIFYYYIFIIFYYFLIKFIYIQLTMEFILCRRCVTGSRAGVAICFLASTLLVTVSSTTV